MTRITTPIATGVLSVIPHAGVEEVPKIHLIRTTLVTARCRHAGVAPSSRPHPISDRAFLSHLEDNNRRSKLLDWRDRGALSVASVLALYAVVRIAEFARRFDRRPGGFTPGISARIRSARLATALSASPRRAHRGAL